MNHNKAMAEMCSRKAQMARNGATLLWAISSFFAGIAAYISWNVWGWPGLFVAVPFYVSAMFALQCRDRYPVMWLRRRQEYLDASRGIRPA